MPTEMKIVEEVPGCIRIFEDGSIDRTWTGPPEAKFLTEPVPPHDEFVDGIATTDLVIDEISGQRVRIYLPEKKPDDKSKLPILLHFHGGGFCITQPNWFSYNYIYSRFTRTARVICVSVYLRLAPENRLPAAIDDGFSALQWLQSVAKGESHTPLLDNADFRRIFLIGDSSGGNLVHHVAAKAGKQELSPLRIVGGIPMQPAFVRFNRSKSELEKPQTPFLTLDMLDKFLGMALPLGSNKDHPITCPMGPSATPLESLNLPPFLLCVAELDLMVDTEIEYYEAMRKAKKDVELFVSPGMTHGFYLITAAVETDPNVAKQTDALVSKIKEFIDKH